MYKGINRLRVLAFLLFLTPLVGILISLFFHNFLVDTKYIFNAKIPDYGIENFGIGEKNYFECNKSNNFCSGDELTYLGQKDCNKYKISKITVDPISKEKIYYQDYRNLK